MRSSLPRLKELAPSLRQIFHQATTNGPSESLTIIQGWIKSIRAHKRVAFVEITDGTTSETLQAVIKSKVKGVENEYLTGTMEG